MAESLDRFGQLKADCIPKNLTGRTVLDIGGYDGRFAKLCLDRGAESAVCLDNQEWSHYQTGTWKRPQRFEGVEYVQGDFLEWEGRYDLVLCFNVLYHCAEWENASPALRRLTKGEMCLSTYWAAGVGGWNEYTEVGTNFKRATPTIPGLFEALGKAHFQEYHFLEVKGEMVVLRCR